MQLTVNRHKNNSNHAELNGNCNSEWGSKVKSASLFMQSFFNLSSIVSLFVTSQV